MRLQFNKCVEAGAQTMGRSSFHRGSRTRNTYGNCHILEHEENDMMRAFEVVQ